MTVKVRLYFCFYALLMAFASLFSGCSADDSTPREAANEICFNADVWRVMEGTRATTFDNQAALQSEGHFTCTLYNANTETTYLTSTRVDWDSEANKWVFSDGTHRWPATGALDFFVYMPSSSLPEYISDLTYVARNPRFTCTDLPMTYNSDSPTAGQGSGLKEFLYDLVIDQDKDNPGETGVSLSFKHPFARIKFQLSASHPDITINSITFKGLKNGGTCTFNGSTSTWSSLTPSDKTENFVMTLNGDAATFNSNPDSELPIGGYSDGAHQSVNILMVPQTFAGDIEVNATWIDWGEPYAHTVTTKLASILWEAGHSYTYTFTITETDLRVDTQKYTEQW